METKSVVLALGVASAALGLAACATDGAGGGGIYITRAAVSANGGAPMNARELKETLSGTLISGPGHSSAWGNVDIDWQLNSDGSVGGTMSRTNIQAGVYPMSGKWNVTDANQVCFDVHSGPTGGSSGGKSPLSGCQEWFKVGSNYYAFQGNTGIRRTVAKR